MTNNTLTKLGLLLLALLVAVGLARGQVASGPGFLIKPATTYTPSTTFLDSSPNNYAITRVGGVTQGNTGPAGGVYSGYFDGTGDWLTHGTGINLGSGNFTLEGWFNTSSVPSFPALYTNRSSPVSSGIYITWDSATSIQFYLGGGGSWFFGQSIGGFTRNAWQHIAIVRSGTTVYVFRGGALLQTYTSVIGTLTSGLGGFVGTDGNASALPYEGNMALFRISDVARYTAAFTPSTSYTSDTNTLLFLRFAN